MKLGFLNFRSIPSFRIGFIVQNENPEMLEIFKPLKTLNFLCQDLSDSTFISQNNYFSSLISNKNQIKWYVSTDLPYNFYCLLLMKSLTRFSFLVILKLHDQFGWWQKHSNHLFASQMKFSKFSVFPVFSSWLYSSKRKPENAGKF